MIKAKEASHSYDTPIKKTTADSLVGVNTLKVGSETIMHFDIKIGQNRCVRH
jgi:hypothetical protein